MTQETGIHPETVTTRPQEIALTLFQSMMNLKENVLALNEREDSPKQAIDLHTSITQVEKASLEASTDNVRQEYSTLVSFTNFICSDPRRGFFVIRGSMEMGGYTSEEISSFFDSVKITRRYREATKYRNLGHTGY